MAKMYFLLLCILTSLTISAQTNSIYSKSYGQSENPAIIFIHGGPSGNSTLFESTTADKLAKKGFYVIVYDRRGEGRSVDTTAVFTYQEAIEDLDQIFKEYKIKKANLIAHSFGGLVATFFTEQYPEAVNSLILAGALFSQQETYDHILKTTKQIYQDKKDTLMLSKIDRIKMSNKNSAQYRKQCFDIAGLNNYFEMPFPTFESDKIREKYKLSEFFKRNIRNNQAPLLFYQNESKNNIDTKLILKSIKKSGVKLFAIYGREDKIFSTKQLSDMQNIVKTQKFRTIDNCSHYLFVDQQQTFIETIENWIK
jgi:proline iminopeptidase